jgi:hypothetical protein
MDADPAITAVSKINDANDLSTLIPLSLTFPSCGHPLFVVVVVLPLSPLSPLIIVSAPSCLPCEQGLTVVVVSPHPPSHCCCWSTCNPPHEQLLMRLGVGGVTAIPPGIIVIVRPPCDPLHKQCTSHLKQTGQYTCRTCAKHDTPITVTCPGLVSISTCV